MRWGRVAVSGRSMLPTLCPGDWLLVRWGSPAAAGDVVVVRLPDRGLGVKRLLSRDADGWWLDADNVRESTDSAVFGAVPEADVLGRVVLRYWPWPPRRVGQRPRRAA